MTLAFDNPMDDFFHRNRAFLEAVRRVQQQRDALGPFYEAAEHARRMHEMARPFQEVERHAQLMDEAMRPMRAALVPVALDASFAREAAIAEVMRNALADRDIRLATSSIALAHDQMAALRSIRLADEVQAVMRAVETQRVILDAASTLATTELSKTLGIANHALLDALSEALQETEVAVADENLLSYILRVAVALWDRLPGVRVEQVLVHLVIPLFVGLLAGGALHVAAARGNERALRQLERAIEKSAKKEVYWIAASSVNVRALDHKNAKLVTKLPVGARFVELDRANDWRLVRTLNGAAEVTGWIYYRNLRRASSAEEPKPESIP